MPKQSIKTKTNKDAKIKKPKTWARKPIPKGKIVDEPKLRVVKLHGRFDKKAKEAGVLSWPKSTDKEPFENYGICSCHPMKELSPMLLGPVRLNGEIFAKNIEDGWQGSKVWSDHMTDGKFDPNQPSFWKSGSKKLDKDGNEWEKEWKKWNEFIRMSGLGKRRHFPKIKDTKNSNIPLFSYFEGERLSYVEARKKMYVKWYWELVQQTKAFQYLKERFDAGISLNLIEFDGMERKNSDDLPEILNEKRLKELINDENVIFGHGMVLAAALLNVKPWEQ